MHRFIRLDGTPCENTFNERKALAFEFDRQDVDLAKVEREVIRRLQRQVRTAVRAYTRLETFKQQLVEWRTHHQQRPAWFAPDSRGRYAWARRELERELRAAWPRSRRKNALQSAVLTAVQSAILRQLQPETDRVIERGLPAKTHRLSERFLQLHYPTLCSGATANRLRRRKGLRRRPHPVN